MRVEDVTHVLTHLTAELFVLAGLTAVEAREANSSTIKLEATPFLIVVTELTLTNVPACRSGFQNEGLED